MISIMKKLLFLLVLFIMSLSTGCDYENKPSNKFTSISQISGIQEKRERLSKYDSPYTICYKNKDGSNSIYIFDSPVQYESKNGQYEIIDNTLIKSDQENIYLENKSNEIKTYFPKNLKKPFQIVRQKDFMEFSVNDIEKFSDAKLGTYTNMYGDEVCCALYEKENIDMVFYSTKSGIKSEIVIKNPIENPNISFTIQSSGKRVENKQNGYIRFTKKDDGEENEVNAGLIYKPLVEYSIDDKKYLDVESTWDLHESKEKYILKIHLNEEIFNNENIDYPIKLDPSFEMHQEKTPDSTVYSKFFTNNYLSNYAIVGIHPTLGEGIHYSRIYMNRYLFIEEQDIISADFHIKNLYGNSKNVAGLQMKSVDEFWSSGQIIWSSRVPSNDQTKYPIMNSEFTFDITQFVKKVVSDQTGNTEVNGLLIQKTEDFDGYSILATSDNSIFTPYIHLRFFEKE